MLDQCKGLKCEERLKRVGLTTLETRGFRADLIEVYKVLKGLEGIDKDIFFKMNQRKSRGNSMKLKKEQARLDLRKYNFSNRVNNEWNSLPENVVTSDSMNIFKGNLDRYLRTTRGLI